MTRIALILSALSAACSVLLLVPVLMQAMSGRLTKARIKTDSNRWAKRVAARLAPKLPPRFVKDTEKRITMAGGLSGLTPELLVFASVVLGCFSFALGTALALSLGNASLPFIFLAGGLVLPMIWLRDRVKARHGEILRQLPFNLDLLTLSIEAGMDFTAGLAKMVEKAKPGALKEEFAYTLSQIRVGVSRGQALKDMAARVDLPQLSNFLSSLVQADKLGMPLGKVLRIQAETIRGERSQRAEQRANEAPVRILIPLVIFIFPTIWIILFAPIVFSFAF
jgi:tight adherence protein C